MTFDFGCISKSKAPKYPHKRFFSMFYCICGDIFQRFGPHKLRQICTFSTSNKAHSNSLFIKLLSADLETKSDFLVNPYSLGDRELFHFPEVQDSVFSLNFMII